MTLGMESSLFDNFFHYLLRERQTFGGRNKEHVTIPALDGPLTL